MKRRADKDIPSSKDVKKRKGEEEPQKEDEDYDMYVVKKILNKSVDKRGNVKYLIFWDGYPESDATWEPIENLQSVMGLIDKFEASLLLE